VEEGTMRVNTKVQNSYNQFADRFAEAYSQPTDKQPNFNLDVIIPHGA